MTEKNLMRKFIIFYRKDAIFRPDRMLTLTDLLDTTKFARVREIDAECLDDAFLKMQAEIWSPRGEAMDHIMSLGLSHTSMSAGDCAIDMSTDKAYQCDLFGWHPVS